MGDCSDHTYVTRVALYISPVDVLQSGIWGDLHGVTAPYLKGLVGELQDAVLSSKAASTTKKYMGAFNRWKRWASQFPEIKPFPASPLHISLYIADLKKSAGTKATIEAAVYGIRWAHQVAGLETPTDHPVVQMAMEGIRKQLGKPTVKKQPITPEILRELVGKVGGARASLADVRGLCICLLGYAGFLRHDEIVKLCFSDVSFKHEHVELMIRSSKTDKYRDGATVVIARTGSPVCPVAMLRRYIGMTKEPAGSRKHLFRPINAKRQMLKDGKLSYSAVREVVLGLLKKVVEDTSVFGVHSLRAGGATAAANSGVHDRQFKRHGRWKSELAKDGYVKDSLDSRLSVSQQLGL